MWWKFLPGSFWALTALEIYVAACTHSLLPQPKPAIQFYFNNLTITQMLHGWVLVVFDILSVSRSANDNIAWRFLPFLVSFFLCLTVALRVLLHC